MLDRDRARPTDKRRDGVEEKDTEWRAYRLCDELVREGEVLGEEAIGKSGQDACIFEPRQPDAHLRRAAAGGRMKNDLNKDSTSRPDQRQWHNHEKVFARFDDRVNHRGQDGIARGADHTHGRTVSRVGSVSSSEGREVS